MRLLKYDPDGKLILKTFDLSENSSLEPYAVLSHTWGNEKDEVTYQDILDGTASSKPGFSKVEFCGREAAREGYKYFWVDTCCIDKSNSTELQEAINSMFRWYQGSARCYVYLSDVLYDRENDGYWERSFRASRWFTRGWTLQELIAPSTVDFFSSEGRWLGDKRKLRQQISEITNIDPEAFLGKPLHLFKLGERWSWSNGRRTKREEDGVYCLLGIFGVHMPLIYGEGYDNARKRIEQTLDRHPNLTIRPKEGIQKKIVFVAVMGLTGVGKSTFISHCTNGAAKASGNLNSCTQEVREYSCTHFEDVDVRLIDTPGFDDSDRSDASVLKDVSQWLGETYKQHILLHGVIYLQRITDIRMQMSSWRSLRALRNVCGNDALKNVYLATTMWEKLATEAEGVEREGLLLEPKYWGDMAKKGCKIHRLQNNAKSALALVRRVIDGSRPIVLQIQRELVDEAKDFDETDAGRELKSELIREREKFQAEKEDSE
ncbi:P-loop containing nucleoside triphosphate hydrolase protein [Xylaria scruposa]|nr:P-loop containing nucleoside triphosphate hydrolase protein [Xylaria scruposa]